MENIIEHLRSKMTQVAKDRGNLTHPDVVAISQRLDRFILLQQQWIAVAGMHAERGTLTNHVTPSVHAQPLSRTLSNKEAGGLLRM